MSKSKAGQLKDLLLPRFFKALGDPTRMSILQKLAEHGQACSVNEIGKSCSVGISAVSRHLAVLREAGILTCQRRGKEVYYQVRTGDIMGMMQGFADSMGKCCPLLGAKRRTNN